MTIEELLDDIAGSAQAAGLVTGSGHVDLAQVELALLQTARILSQTIDVQSFQVVADPLFRTEAGVPEYALPSDFGRFVHPEHEDDTGIYLRASTATAGGSALKHMSATEMLRRQPSQTLRPTHYTLVSGNKLRLFPTPNQDAASDDYIVSGVYIKRISAEDLMGDDLDVSLPESTFLKDGTIARLALDLDHDRAEAYGAVAQSSYAQLANGIQRQRQRFQRRRAGTRWPRNTLRGINS